MSGNNGLHRLALPHYRKHNVHVYVEVRVKVCGINAPSHREAINMAEQVLEDDLYRMYPDNSTAGEPGDYPYVVVEDGGVTDDIAGFTVDEENDPEYELTTQHNADGTLWVYKGA